MKLACQLFLAMVFAYNIVSVIRSDVKHADATQRFVNVVLTLLVGAGMAAVMKCAGLFSEILK